MTSCEHSATAPCGLCELTAENDRLRERCEAYKGQVWAGSQEIERLRTDAARYRYLRNRPEDTIGKGGIFAGRTPPTGSGGSILTEGDLDRAVDAAIADEQAAPAKDRG